MTIEESIGSLENIELVHGIRDFFLSTQGDEMHAALEALNYYKYKPESEGDKDKLLNLEYAFNRLFIGPDKVLAPPFASIYLSAEPTLMGKACQDMTNLLEEMELELGIESSLPNDHISIVLEVWFVIAHIMDTILEMHEESTNQEEIDNLESLFDYTKEKMTWLEKEHLIWIQDFIKKIDSAPSECLKLGETLDFDEIIPDEISYVQSCLEVWYIRFIDENYEFEGIKLP